MSIIFRSKRQAGRDRKAYMKTECPVAIQDGTESASWSQSQGELAGERG